MFVLRLDLVFNVQCSHCSRFTPPLALLATLSVLSATHFQFVGQKGKVQNTFAPFKTFASNGAQVIIYNKQCEILQMYLP